MTIRPRTSRTFLHLHRTRPLQSSLTTVVLALVGAVATGCGSSDDNGATTSNDGGPSQGGGDGGGSTTTPSTDGGASASADSGKATSGGDASAGTDSGFGSDAAFDAGQPVDTAWTGRPPAAPLFVRNPYLNIWSAADSVSGTWPTLWAGEVKGMTGIARIDGTSYLLIGAVSPSGLTQLGTPMTQVSRTLTPTKTEYVLAGGGVNVTLDFLSPVEIDDLQHQSAPIGYLTMSAAATDGASHDASVYVDISGEWANGDSTQEVTWKTEAVPHAGGTLTVQSITSQNPNVLSENSDYVQWGTAFLAADGPGMTTGIDSDVNLRTMMVQNGALNNTDNTTSMPRPIDQSWPVLGYAFDLGSVTAASTTPVTLELGLARTPAVSYQGAGVPPLWASYWSTFESMAADVYDDFSSANGRAQALDQRVVRDALAAQGEHYAALCTLALRQAFGGTELVGTKDQPWLFLKEISSDGNISTVDVVYPASPVFLYTNPYYLKILLDPLLTYAETETDAGASLWPQPFAEHDIGASYPNADGHNDGGGENMPVEESANMLLMMAAYAQRANATDGQAYASLHYAIAKKWTTFLTTSDTGLDTVPPNNATTDDFCQSSQSGIANLSLKAVLGVGAMGVLAQIAGNTADAASYISQAQALMARWITLATDPSGSYTNYAYGQSGTWGLKYNAFYDKELKMNLVPASLLASEATYYGTQALAFGVPLDSRFLNTSSGCAADASKTDWQLWMASAIDNPAVVTTMIDGVYNFATSSTDRVPFSDYYDTQTGQQVAFQARPVQGGMFSFLALSGSSIVAQ